jgi:hypothetical protein
MTKTATKTPDDEEDRCPNCGYCPHCGQSAKPRTVPMPYPYPVPYRVYTQPWTEREIGVPWKVWCGTTEGVKPETISVSPGNEYVQRKGTEC